MKFVEFIEAMDRVNIHGIPCDLGIFRPSSEKITPRYMSHYDIYSYGVEDVPPSAKTVIVYVLFTAKAFDYYIREDFTLNLLIYLNNNYDGKFFYDNYRILRKESAVYAGMGKIGRNSLLFSDKFGFNCKIDLLLTDVEFDDADYTDYESDQDYRLDLCEQCSICLDACPIRCGMNFILEDAYKCGHNLDMMNPDRMCRSCITGCPYSESLLENVPEKTRKRRFRYTFSGDTRIPPELDFYHCKHERWR